MMFLGRHGNATPSAPAEVTHTLQQRLLKKPIPESERNQTTRRCALLLQNMREEERMIGVSSRELEEVESETVQKAILVDQRRGELEGAFTPVEEMRQNFANINNATSTRPVFAVFAFHKHLRLLDELGSMTDEHVRIIFSRLQTTKERLIECKTKMHLLRGSASK